MRSLAVIAAVATTVAIACSDGSVARYAACTAADSCPSSTKCESPASQVVSFCTAACTSSHDCPSDGVCTSDVGPSASPYCYEPCPDSGCVGGECASVVATDTSIVKVCIPGLSSAISATSWTSATIATQGKNVEITASSYAVTFAMGEFSPDAITVSGAFSATFTQTYGASSPSVYAGCTETTTFAGGTWTTAQGKIVVSGATGSTDRTGCATSSKNVTGALGVYDASMNATSGAPYDVKNGTLTISGGGGALPYSDKVDWTFTKT